MRTFGVFFIGMGAALISQSFGLGIGDGEWWLLTLGIDFVALGIVWALDYD